MVDGKEWHNFDAAKPVTVKTVIPAGLREVQVVYNGDPAETLADEAVEYTKETGALTFKTTHFSEFEVRSAVPMVGATAAKAINDSSISEVTLDGDIHWDDEGFVSAKNPKNQANMQIKSAKTIDLHQHSLNGSQTPITSGNGIEIMTNQPVIIKNGTFNSTSNTMLTMYKGCNVTFENVTFKIDWYTEKSMPDQTIKMNGIQYDYGNKTTVKFVNCIFEDTDPDLAPSYSNPHEVEISFEKCTFNAHYNYDKTGGRHLQPVLSFNSFYQYGNISLKNCIINYDVTGMSPSNGVSVIKLRGTNEEEKKLTLTLTNNIITITGGNQYYKQDVVSKIKGRNNEVVDGGSNTFTLNGESKQFSEVVFERDS